MPEFEIGDYAFFFDWRQFMRYAAWFTILLIVLHVNVMTMNGIMATIPVFLLIAYMSTTRNPSLAAIRRALKN